MRHNLHPLQILASLGEAAWFLFGLAAWLITFGAATVEVSSGISGARFTFKGWC